MLGGVAGIEVWSQFEQDPRVPANAPIRASDRDRDVIATVLGNAFAEGRLTSAEYDERATAALASRTLGELVPLVADLPTGAPAPRSSIPEQAARAYAHERRQAVWGFLSASIVCWVIWLFTGQEFPWPVFVMLGTGLNAGRVVWQKDEIIDGEIRRLEKRERRELRKREDED